jgi:pimeloyl-ACP methyl ester carboxylesterase
LKAKQVRALYRASRISGEQAPYDNVTLKIHYPCQFADSLEERKTGVIPAETGRAPFAVVVLLPDIDISHENYSWLAAELAQAGFAAVTYSWIAEDQDGLVRSTPGIHLKRLTKKRFGRKPSCPALPAIFSELKRVNRSGPLAGLLNLSCVILGGHAAGGRMALLNANTDWFPSVCGVFSYAGHTLAEPELGWDKRNVIPLPPDMPILLIGGTDDSVIATAERPRDNREATGATGKIERTFRQGVKGKRGDRYLVLVEGGSHFALAAPRDGITGFTFLEDVSRGGGKPLRKYLARLIVTFCDSACRGDPMSGADLKALVDSSHAMVAHSDQK